MSMELTYVARNKNRADAAEHGLDAYVAVYGGDPTNLKELFTDFFADLGHLAERYDVDYKPALRRAMDHYTSETAGHGIR